MNTACLSWNRTVCETKPCASLCTETMTIAKRREGREGGNMRAVAVSLLYEQTCDQLPSPPRPFLG